MTFSWFKTVKDLVVEQLQGERIGDFPVQPGRVMAVRMVRRIRGHVSDPASGVGVAEILGVDVQLEGHHLLVLDPFHVGQERDIHDLRCFRVRDADMRLTFGGHGWILVIGDSQTDVPSERCLIAVRDNGRSRRLVEHPVTIPVLLALGDDAPVRRHRTGSIGGERHVAVANVGPAGRRNRWLTRTGSALQWGDLQSSGLVSDGYLKRIHARPAYKRALKAGGPYSFADD